MKQLLVRADFTTAIGRAALLTLVLGLCMSLLIATVQVALLNTVLLFLFVTFVGLQQCRTTQRKLSDNKLRVLGNFWLIKLGLTLFLLYVGWIPQLDQNVAPTWGYDPQRYYVDAYELLKNGWIPIQNTYYQGIIFYYGAIFYLFGYNPVIPAIINAFVTLLGLLYLIRLAYEFKGVRGPQDWTIAYLLVIPEILWFDVMTSRETLLAVFIIVTTLSAGRYIVHSSRVSLGFTLLISGIGLVVISAVRTSMLIPVVAAIVLMLMLLRSRLSSSYWSRIFMVALAVAFLVVGPLVQHYFSSYKTDYMGLLNSVLTIQGNAVTAAAWSNNSIGLLISPNNPWQAILFGFPRMILYFIAPLPNIYGSVSELIAGNWFYWQRLMMALTSVLNLLVLPYAIAGFGQAYKHRRTQPAPLVLHFSFWITFMGIAFGNIIIHERYRVMVTMLLFACAWLGRTTCTRAQVWNYALPWYGMLILGAVFVVLFKAS